MRPEYRTAIKTAISLGIPVGLFGISFGALAAEAGMSKVQACVMSLSVFAGGAQLVAASVLGAGGFATAVIAALALNARYLGLGVALSPKLDGPRARRALAAHLLIDESAALALAEPERSTAEVAFWVTGLVLFVTWNLGTAVGVAVGAVVDIASLGLDAAIPAALFVVLAPMLSGGREWVAAIAGAGLAVASAPVVPPGIPFLIAAGGAVVAMTPMQRRAT